MPGGAHDMARRAIPHPGRRHNRRRFLDILSRNAGINRRAAGFRELIFQGLTSSVRNGSSRGARPNGHVSACSIARRATRRPCSDMHHPNMLQPQRAVPPSSLAVRATWCAPPGMTHLLCWEWMLNIFATASMPAPRNTQRPRMDISYYYLMTRSSRPGAARRSEGK